MTIAKADILAAVNAAGAFGLDQAAVDLYTKRCVVELSKAGLYLEAEDTFNTVDGTAYYAAPTGFQRMISLHITGSAKWGLLTWGEYLARLAADSAKGEPEKFCLRMGRIYPWPVPDAAYTVIRKFWKYHPEVSGGTSTDAILFPDDYREVIYNGVIYRVAKDKERWDIYRAAREEYQSGLQDLLNAVTREPQMVHYCDL